MHYVDSNTCMTRPQSSIPLQQYTRYKLLDIYSVFSTTPSQILRKEQGERERQGTGLRMTGSAPAHVLEIAKKVAPGS